MTNFPFGFNPGGSGLPDDLSKVPFFAELQRLMSGSGPVNWELAKQIAVSGAGSESEPGSEVGSSAESLRLAEIWLDGVTALPAGATVAQAWTRTRWVEATLATWQTLCDPVATRVVAAMRSALPQEVQAQASPLVEVMNQVGALMFGMQVGQALGALSQEVLSSTDVGLPVGPAGTAALLPSNVAAFGADLGVPAAEVELYVALRESAYHRLYAHVPWLRRHLLDAIDAYAQGIKVDTERIEAAMSSVDPTDPESLQNAMSGGLFEHEDTPQQQASLARLELMLALVEGWVDHVVDEAATGRLPSAAALRETVRRRRATGGPAEQTFATLVGLQLRPRRLRDAATLWAALAKRRGNDGRDAIWSHPDLLPDSEALDDPLSFVEDSGDPPLSLTDGDLGPTD